MRFVQGLIWDQHYRHSNPRCEGGCPEILELREDMGANRLQALEDWLQVESCLGGLSCMVKIRANAPNSDHAKNSFSHALFFENRILVQRKYLSYHLCRFLPFF